MITPRAEPQQSSGAVEAEEAEKRRRVVGLAVALLFGTLEERLERIGQGARRCERVAKEGLRSRR